MSDSLQRVVVSRTLWLVVAPPLAAFAWQLARGLRRGGVAYDPWPRRVAIGSSVFVATMLFAHAIVLARAPDGTRALVWPAAVGPRPAAFVPAFALAFDRLSETICALACVVALGVSMLIVARNIDRRRWQPWAWLQLSLGGGLLSFLADGLATTVLGWVLASAASSWLAGSMDSRGGALRATRGALAVMAALLGGALLSGRIDAHWDAGEPVVAPGTASAALAAFVVASGAMSASSSAPGTQPLLGALERAATAGVLGPFLLFRVAFLVPRAALGTSMISAAGVALVVFAARRSRVIPAGPLRWVALAGSAPAGLTLVAFGANGVPGGMLVLEASGIVAALLLAAGAPFSTSSMAATPRPSFERALLGHAPESGAILLMAFERFVLDALAGSIAIVARALAWVLSRFDAQVVDAPSNALAAQVVRASHRLEPLVGGSLVRVAWAVVAAVGLVAMVHAFWPVR